MATLFAWHRTVLRRLLQLDREVPAVTDEDAHQFMLRNYRWNFTVNLLDGASFFRKVSR